MRWVLVCLAVAGCAAGGRTVVTQGVPQPFCTRTLGMAECFADPASLPDHPTQLVDAPVRTHTDCAPWWRDGGALCHLGQPGRP